ncbi:MAG: RecQ family ATP-dependent DNA helicase [Flavobacteriales bacterium]|nr:RecQ family ATP-dependent DNA helicase [Flavobacteriales bacterium]
MASVMELTPKKALKQFFGFSQYKGLQEVVVQAVLDKEDTFVIMPTGGGKSLCYQLPALMLEGTAIVVSPLIALMKNQVDAMRGFSTEDGIAHFINSSLNKTEINQVKSDITSGRCKLLYVAPESLVKEENVEFLKSVKISFVAIDEAHCISEWGHDFRPEYRRLRPIIQQIANVPIMALTATATPKVQQDVQKNLGMTDAKLFKASFNRPNLYYEIRPKINVGKQIIQYIKANTGKSGIIYCLSRRKTEELAELLQVNGIKALPYHAGMDSATRSSVQDRFLMSEVHVIVATIAFGMGIDKPDVRFVIHHDIPKSLESYYQETGRGGRDGGEGVCLAFYSPRDIEKLEKFLHGKPVAEQEIGWLLLQEVVAYAETSMSRRKYLLHYFGEEWDEVNGEGAGMDDNSRHPKEHFEAKDEVQLLLRTIKSFDEMHKAAFICRVVCGVKSNDVTTYKGHKSEFFGEGNDHDEKFWNAIIRQMFVRGYVNKEIETYGTLKITQQGHEFIENPVSFLMPQEEDIGDVDDDDQLIIPKQGGGAVDQELYRQLVDLRSRVSKEKKLPPYVIFQDPALEEMCFSYPITLDEMAQVGGVGKGKAQKFGQPFVDHISGYVTENEIERPQDYLVKTAGAKSSQKVQIIQNIDKRIPFPDIAKGLGKEMSELMDEMETIVNSGTKLHIHYYIDEVFDEEQQKELMEYFMGSDTDNLEVALESFDGDYEIDELRLMRLKFMSEVGT